MKLRAALRSPLAEGRRCVCGPTAAVRLDAALAGIRGAARAAGRDDAREHVGLLLQLVGVLRHALAVAAAVGVVVEGYDPTMPSTFGIRSAGVLNTYSNRPLRSNP